MSDTIYNIELTETQICGLSKLWFVFGNGGKKHTSGNHGFIQGFIEHKEDRRKFYTNVSYKRAVAMGYNIKELELTYECINAVDKILNEG